jgi:hypothetical protein
MIMNNEQPRILAASAYDAALVTLDGALKPMPLTLGMCPASLRRHEDV